MLGGLSHMENKGEIHSVDSKLKKKKIISNMIKWVMIFGLLLFAYIKNKEFMYSAFVQVKVTPINKIVWCLILSNLYFLAEGCIISSMTATGEKKLTILQGMSCAYMCAFYRLATLGSGNGIAQLYYYNTKGISVSRGTGMALSQYTFQKITIGIMGVLSFLCLVISGETKIMKYYLLMLAGVVVISAICLFLFAVTVSEKISQMVINLGKKIIKPEKKLYIQIERGEKAIHSLQEQGRLVWHNRKLFFIVVILNILKFACWYVIPGILFAEEYSVNVFLCLAIMAVCNMLGCVMVAPSGVGTLEFVFALLFGTIIPHGEIIAAAIIIYRLFTWILPFIIGLIPATFLKKERII